MRYAALLRGINVGGNKKVAMAELRELLAGLGYEDITTYLQSGNAVFSSPPRDARELAGEIAAAVRDQLGVSIQVVVRTGAEVAAAVRACPLPGDPENPSRFFVAFLGSAPATASVEALMARSFGADQVWVSGQEAYLWCPEGASQTGLTNAVLEKSLGVTATSRNWNTVLKLAGLMAG